MRSRSARAVFQEVDDALSQKLSAHHVGRAGKRSDADRECPARDHGGLARRHPGAAKGRRPGSRAACPSGGRSFAGRIFRALRGGRLLAGGHGAASQNSRAGDAVRRAGGRGRDDRLDRRRYRNRRSGGEGCGGRRRRLRRRQRQCARPGGAVGIEGRDGPRRRHRQGQGRQARHSACRFPRRSIVR